YLPDVTYPDGVSRIESFQVEPWPRWTFALPDGTRVQQDVFVPKGSSAVAVSWRRLSGPSDLTLELRPFFAGRGSHSLLHQNPALRFDAAAEPSGVLRFRTYLDVPSVAVRSNGAYTSAPEWYRNFLYEEERARGLDFSEDLASPGVFRFDLSAAEAVWLAAAEGHEAALGTGTPVAALETLRAAEQKRRESFGSRLERSADAYLVRRGTGLT